VAALAFTLGPFAVAGVLALLGGGADGPWRIWLPAGLVAVSAIAVGVDRRAAWPWAAVALAGFVLLQTVELPSRWHTTQQDLAQALATAGVTLRSAVSFDASATALGALQLAAAIGAFALARAGASRSLQSAVVAVLALSLVCTAETLLGASQYLAGLVSEGGEAVARGTFTSRAHSSAFLLGGMGAALGLGFAALQSGLRRASAAVVVCWTLAAVCAIGVALSLSRAGILAASAQAFAAAWWLAPRQRRGTALAATAAFAIAVMALSPQMPRLAAERFIELAEVKGDPGRLAIWNDTAPLVRRYALLGVGLEAYPFAFRRSGPYFARKTVQHAHSDPLEFAVELGIPAATLLVGATLMVGLFAARAAHRQEATARAITVGCLLGASGIALQSLVDSPLHLPATVLSFAALLGTASGLAVGPKKPSWTLRLAGMAVAGAVLVNAFLWMPRSTPEAFERAEKLLAQGQSDEAVNTYRELLALNPFVAPAWQRMASIARAEGRRDHALSFARAAHQVEPHTLRTVWPLAETELQLGDAIQAVERLAALVDREPDLRPAAFVAAYRGGAPVELIEARLAQEEAYAAGEYLAFLTRIDAWDRWPVAYARFGKNLGDAHRRFLDQAVAERQSALDHSTGR